MTHALTFPILKRLSNGAFQSGEALAKHFNVSRATIWNAVQDAQTLGIEVFSVRGRGYKLPNSFDWLSVEAILQAIHQENLTQFFTLEVHDTLPSTNSYLMQKLITGLTQPTCVMTNFQTAGRGRRGRSWQAGLGCSLTFSVFWRFQCGAAALSGLSLAVGVALTRAFNTLGVTQAKIKWPNDIVVKNQNMVEKLAGTLIELQGDMEGPTAAVIGVGINLHLPDKLKNTIDQPATDLTRLLTKNSHARINTNTLLANVLHALGNVLTNFEQQGFANLREEWTSYHAYHQEMVRMLHPNGSETMGKVSNVAEDGVLLVTTEVGVMRFSSGEISLRGLT